MTQLPFTQKKLQSPGRRRQADQQSPEEQDHPLSDDLSQDLPRLRLSLPKTPSAPAEGEAGPNRERHVLEGVAASVASFLVLSRES